MEILHERRATTDDLLSDGVTRVVAVQASAHDGGAPLPQHMHTSESKVEELRVASAAMSLQQSLVQELLDMDENERHTTLQRAAAASRQSQLAILALATKAERVDYLRNLDAEMQRLLALHKVWEAYTAGKR